MSDSITVVDDSLDKFHCEQLTLVVDNEGVESQVLGDGLREFLYFADPIDSLELQCANAWLVLDTLNEEVEVVLVKVAILHDNLGDLQVFVVEEEVHWLVFTLIDLHEECIKLNFSSKVESWVCRELLLHTLVLFLTSSVDFDVDLVSFSNLGELLLIFVSPLVELSEFAHSLDVGQLSEAKPQSVV